ncbi:hypothetical protein [Wenjunlia tyrosinilytica]|uniref:Uncharacterized protein n=1 Tax=Wenjunlia tyrosinilytica TaxID=1544741 RepID=A0A917ZZD3_9ACTN|nr:hypothetical protein [Wenjunlia tyrosinilytica]GGO98760.1 hypothetical protein GCM10012280_63650 [Wenjunlia tyrosinilytica]
MTTPPHEQRIEALAARVREGIRERDAAFGPRPQPSEGKAQKPKAQAQKELREQRDRLRAAGRRRLTSGQSRRPRPRQSRIGSAAARRDARALSRMRHSTAWLW